MSNRDKAIHLVVSSGRKVTVIGYNNLKKNISIIVNIVDTFLGLPCDSMKQNTFTQFEYLVLSASSQHPIFNLGPLVFSLSSIMIIPCEDGTDVTIYYHSQDANFISSDISANPRNAGPSSNSLNTVFTASDAGKTILIQSSKDLSGTIVRSNKPMVVYIGHQCAIVPNIEYNFCDLIVEQAPPSLAWGFTFFLNPQAYRESGDLYRVGTLVNGALVKVTCTSAGSAVAKRLLLPKSGRINRGQWIEFTTPANVNNYDDWKPDYCCLESEKPVFVVHYSQGFVIDTQNLAIDEEYIDFGNPSMTIVSPLTQFMKSFIVTSISELNFSSQRKLKYVNVAVHSSFGFTNITIISNGTILQLNDWNPFYCSNGFICGWGIPVEIETGLTVIQHNTPGAAIGVSTYGFQYSISYGHPAGMELTPLGGMDVNNKN